MKIKKFINFKTISITIFIICIIFNLYNSFINFINLNEEKVNNNDIFKNEEVIKADGFADLKEIYINNKEINDDYVGQIYFESGLINLPFVQGETNDSYLRTDWKSGKYDIGGSIFLDASNDVDNDQNIILYGHNYPESYDDALSKMFTSLHLLKDINNYYDKRVINLFLGNKILKYEIVSVFRVKIIEDDGVQIINEDEPIYVIRNYSKDEFDEYISKINKRQYYDTDVTIESTDRLLTLQTCFDNSLDKLVVLAKMIEEIPIE